MSGNTNRRKGHNAERYYAKKFRDLGFTKCKTARYGSRLYDDSKIDLINIPFNIQIKAGQQRYMNTPLILQDMKKAIHENFEQTDPVHNKPLLLIHKKDVGSGNTATPEHELMYMSMKTFEEFKEIFPFLNYIRWERTREDMYGEFDHIFVITFEEFQRMIIRKKKIFIND